MGENKRQELLRMLPPVHELQKDTTFYELKEKFELTDDRLTGFIQEALHDTRQQLIKGKGEQFLGAGSTLLNYIWLHVEQKVEENQKERLVNVINGTGTVLHTNLGRARLSEEAIKHVSNVAGNYSNLEYKIEPGTRGSRHDILEGLLVEITGAEAAMVVNNNAAAVYLVLRALAKEREVIVSRGELIEIGGSFRISSIMEESGAALVEVGTTNKTHIFDYERALSDQTAMLMKVHTSNFKTVGFTESVDRKALAELKSQQENLIFYEDLGSGSLFDFRSRGIGEEPVVREVINSGVDLVSFSGDKLLGGPQAGIIAGKKKYIDRLKKHQLARVLRVDKMTFAGLEKTLRAYSGSEEQLLELPVARDILKTKEAIRQQAVSFLSKIECISDSYQAELTEDNSQIGGGTMPDVLLPTYAVAVRHDKLTAEQLARKLRRGRFPVVSRIKEESIIIDFRTITEKEMPMLIETFTELA